MFLFLLIYISSKSTLRQYIVLRSFLRRFAKPEEFLRSMHECRSVSSELVNAQKSLILEETEIYYSNAIVERRSTSTFSQVKFI